MLRLILGKIIKERTMQYVPKIFMITALLSVFVAAPTDLQLLRNEVEQSKGDLKLISEALDKIEGRDLPGAYDLLDKLPEKSKNYNLFNKYIRI